MGPQKVQAPRSGSALLHDDAVWLRPEPEPGWPRGTHAAVVESDEGRQHVHPRRMHEGEGRPPHGAGLTASENCLTGERGGRRSSDSTAAPHPSVIINLYVLGR